MSLTVPPLLQTGMVAAALRWERERGVERLWARDAELWTGSGEDQWLGWLEAPTRAPLEELDGLRQETAAEGIRDVLLLGMGGSSLAPEVLINVILPVRLTVSPSRNWAFSIFSFCT